jgi:hypothetical protein|tara:strand:- start:621 stop:2150 length:1530 start_codon:yes stop_codon:yes gene_type:complete
MQGIAALPYEVYELPMIPEGGIQQYEQAADMLAEFGRNGDTYIVHAAEGETMVPMEVLDNNPRLKKMLFTQMEEMGIEPDRYIVGNELNSINPVTGQPEFFLKKAFRKLKRGVKKAGKSIAKVAKKVAPIILPIAAPFLLPAMPLAFASGIGSLAGGLIAGQDFSTALKGAVITGGLAGLGNMAFGGSGGFGSGKFFGSYADPTAGLGNFSFKQAFTPVNPFSQAGQAQLAALRAQSAAQNARFPVSEQAQLKALGQDVTYPEGQNFSQKLVQPSDSLADPSPFAKGGADTPITDLLKTPEPPSTYDKAVEFYQQNISPSGRAANLDNAKVLADAKQIKAQTILQQEALGIPVNEAEIAKAALEKATVQNTPGVISQYAPVTALGTAGAVAADYATDGAILGIFTDDDDDGLDDDTGMTMEEYKSAYPEKFFDPNKFYGTNPSYQGFATVAQGGEIVGPGTPTSDSIPALLSDGEFVMNAAAVRGAGGGDRKEGAKKMYAMMRQFEGRA